MPSCSVIGCTYRKEEKQSLSLHRLPRNENKKQKWLAAIGTERITLNVKNIFICSLHFHESAFNKTLDVIRLHDDAIPIPHGPTANQDESYSLKENKPDKTQASKDDSYLVIVEENEQDPLADKKLFPPPASHDHPYVLKENKQDPLADNQNFSNLLPGNFEIVDIAPHSAGTSRCRKLLLPVASVIPTKPTAIGPSPSEDPGQTKIKKLEQRCDVMRRKVRALNEKVRRQKKTIANLRNAIREFASVKGGRNKISNSAFIEF